jgi:hypothetical protein
VADNIDSLVLEQLRQLRAQNDRILDEIRVVKTELQALRHHSRGVELTQDGHHEDIARIKVRLDRIERRLELSDGTSS